MLLCYTRALCADLASEISLDNCGRDLGYVGNNARYVRHDSRSVLEEKPRCAVYAPDLATRSVRVKRYVDPRAVERSVEKIGVIFLIGKQQRFPLAVVHL